MIDEHADTQIGRAVQAILDARYQPKVGDRVRIRLSGECDVDWGASYKSGHPSTFDGMEGTIIEDRRPLDTEWGQTHPFPVRFDDMVFVPLFANGDDGWWAGNYFSSTELERLP